VGEPILDPGRQAGMCLHDGTEWRKAKGDTDGHAQVDVLSSALPSGAATETTLSSVLSELKRPGVTGGRCFIGSQAPTGWTEKWRYTVPSGKRAKVTFVYAWSSTTTSNNQVQVRIEAHVNGGTVLTVLLHVLSKTDEQVVTSVGCQVELRESDYIRMFVVNTDTVSRWIGGSCTYFEQSA